MAGLVGSRYELCVTDDGTRENRAHKSYAEIYETDCEAPADLRDDTIGYVHSIDVGSTVDGPGIRFVLFLTGCPLRCQYCHNPDTWHKRNGRQYTIDRIMKEIGKYVKVLEISRGGLTISGG